jgi:RNA polymerase sigma factor (sigma-70 family)
MLASKGWRRRQESDPQQRIPTLLVFCKISCHLFGLCGNSFNDMITQEAVTSVEYIPDAELVARTLAGDRNAFDRIVSRYQILICSLAYSRIGHLGHSEDVAQETFITAWKHLRLLRQPEKLRAWLCGIVNNRAKKCLRHEVRRPLLNAEPLETAAELPVQEALPSEQTISREEEAILWRSLEKIPELYREPLILFYREHQSIENVAAELELTEDAVKQRLSRGRKLLQEGIEDFVEKTLRRTTPTPAFSGAVMAALPLATNSVVSAGAVGAAGKGTLTLKGLLLAFLLPFIGMFTGFGAALLMFQGPKSHVTKLRLIVTWAVVLGFAIGGQYAVSFAGHHFNWSDPVFFAAEVGFAWFFYTCLIAWIVPIYRHAQADARAAEMKGIPVAQVPTSRFAAIVAGTHLMMFWGFIDQAWHAQDRMGAAFITGLMVAMAIWNFFKLRNVPLGIGYIHQLASCGVVTLIILNLRLDNWINHPQGTSIADIHEHLPVWMIPVLTLVLVLWTVFLMARSKPKAAGSSATR